MHTYSNYTYRGQKSEEASQHISMRIRKQYQKRLDELQTTCKITKALNQVCPKIDKLIESDTSDTKVENKLYSGEHYIRRSLGYRCSPQMSILRTHPVPEKIQDMVIGELDDQEEPPLFGMIQEIDIGFYVNSNSFYYWSLTSKNHEVQSVELDHKIISVGLVKPPSGFFSGIKCDHMLLLGSDHAIIGCEITYMNQFNRGKITSINKLDIQIGCENISHSKIHSTDNSRIFIGCKDACLNELKFSTTRAWFTHKTTKKVSAEEKRNSSWIWKIIPKLFSYGSKQIDRIVIDEIRHIAYTLSFYDYNDETSIRDCNIDIYYLGALGESFQKVASISQLDLFKQYEKSSAGSSGQPLQIIGLHYISITESSEVHFLLVTSTGQRIYVSLDVRYLDSEKFREIARDQYTSFFNEVPNGSWKISGVVNPPFPKDVSSFSSSGISCCTEIGFDHTDL